MKKFVKIAIAVIIIAAICIGCYFLLHEEVYYNEGYVNGNLPGNLYNGGQFCEHNGTIFFANPEDNNKLYSMDLSGNNLKKLSEDVATYINADDHYVYYVRNNVNENLDYNFFSFYRNALVRLPRDGGSVKILDTEPCMYASLLGNYIYYIHYDKEDASTLYKICIDGTDRKQVSAEAFFTCCTDGQYFYYNGMTTSGSIFRYDTASDTSSVIFEGNCYKPITLNHGSSFFYIDGDKGTGLTSVDIASNTSTLITDDNIDFYNVYGEYIYYQKYDVDNSGLCRVKKDGTDMQILKKGDYKNIHVTSSHVYFADSHSNTVYYFTHNNPVNIMIFDPDIITD